MAVRDFNAYVTVATVVLTACANTLAESKPKSVDFVVQSFGALEGTKVKVAGHLRFGDDAHNLWSSRAAVIAVSSVGYIPDDDPRWTHCITLRNFGNQRPTLLRKNGHSVVITGIVNRVVLKPDEIEIGACSEIGLSVLDVK